MTYSEISSNFISDPRALFAAVASSSPVASIGPAQVSRVQVAMRFYIPVRTISWPLCWSANPCFPLPVRTCATTCAMSFYASVHAQGDATRTYTKGNRCELMIFPDGDREDLFVLCLRSIQEKILGIESRATTVSNPKPSPS